ncbi:MAG: GYD domain-containing protein [Candidatus Thorarchaeota archaeon]|jgi:uncharacterized protein with GYD domain
MPTFIILAKFTAEGIKGLKKAPERLKKAQEIAKSVGAEIKGIYYTMGRYDYVAITESDSVETAMAGLFRLGLEGTASTETLVGLSAEDGLKVIAELP